VFATDRVFRSPRSRSCRSPGPTARPTQQLERRAVRELGRRVRIGRAQPLEELRAFFRAQVCALLARARSIAAPMIARFFSAPRSCLALSALARVALRALRVRARGAPRAARSACAPRPPRRVPDDIVALAGTISIQSTGQGGTQRSHPEQSSVTTVCMSFAARRSHRPDKPGCTTCIRCSAPRRSLPHGAAARRRSQD